MDKQALVIIAIPSLLAVIFYASKKWFSGAPPLSGDCFEVFWKSTAFIGSALMIVAQFIDYVKTFMGNMELYVIAAGVFLCADTFEALRKKFIA